MNPLADLTVAMIGGDDRDLVLAEELTKRGAAVRIAGFPKCPGLAKAKRIEDLLEVVKGADVALLPMPGTDANLVVRAVYTETPFILTEEWFRALGPHVPVFVGVARPAVKEMAKKNGVKLVEIADLDEVAILNSIPTAEGAIQMAMEETPITITGSRSVVIGFGRVGQTLARMLKGIGARVTVVDRSPITLARAHEMGHHTHHVEEMQAGVKDAEILFNTAPNLVLDRAVLSVLPPDTLIVDLATAPGGTDFPAARELGIKAILAPALPGKVAPKTAGLILARVYPRLFREVLREVRSDAFERC